MDGTQRPTKTPASLLALMPTPNQSETEKRNDKQAAASISQSALVNTSFTSASLFVLHRVDEVAVWQDSLNSNIFEHRDNSMAFVVGQTQSLPSRPLRCQI